LILNRRCITAAVFAVFFAPILDMMAVTQVPMFWPRMMGTAAAQVLGAATEMSRQSEHLGAEVARFLATVRAA